LQSNERKKLKLNDFKVLAISALVVFWSADVSSLTIEPNVLRVPEDYPRIQQAIHAANPGDTVHVAAGTYLESLEITKPLRLAGEGPDKTIVAGTGTVMLVTADNVEITGFAVQNGTYGIFLWYSTGSLLRNNSLAYNKWNFGVFGNSSFHFFHNIDSSNTVDRKPIYYWLNQHHKRVPKDAGYVALVNSTNITVADENLTSNEQGVLLVDTRESIINNVTMLGNDKGIVLRTSSNNTVRNNKLVSINYHGFYMVFSHNNTFYENTMLNNTCGMEILQSNRNSIYHNNFIGNKVQQYQTASSNFWHNQAGQGNYWSDYNGTDTDGDGVGETSIPHLGVDYYPLMSIYDTVYPIARAGENQTVPVDTAVSFNASGSTDNVGIARYLWDFGDSSTGAGITTTHTYATPGKYTATLTVEDWAGNSVTERITITVVEAAKPFAWGFLIAGISAGALALAVVIIWMRKSFRK
jgi:parallel beta-helix repeat protein